MFKQLRKEADAVQQRDAALCSFAGVGLLALGALRRGLLEGLPEDPLVVRPYAQRLAPPVGRLRDAELLVHLLAPAPRHGGATTRLLLEHFQLREQLRPVRLQWLPVEADAVQQRDVALCSFAGVFLLGRGALRRGLLEGLPVVPLVVRPSAQRLAPLPQPR